MRILGFCLLLCYNCATVVFTTCKPYSDLDFIQKAALDFHNRWRRLHEDTPDLCWGESDNTHTYNSKKWSKQMASEVANRFQMRPSGNKDVGENLYWSCFQVPIDPAHYNWATTYWYAEIKDLDLVKKMAAQGTNIWNFVESFVQLIWSETKEVNCGHTLSTKGMFVICQYYPPGRDFTNLDKYVHELMIPRADVEKKIEQAKSMKSWEKDEYGGDEKEEKINEEYRRSRSETKKGDSNKSNENDDEEENKEQQNKENENDDEDENKEQQKENGNVEQDGAGSMSGGAQIAVIGAACATSSVIVGVIYMNVVWLKEMWFLFKWRYTPLV